MAEDTRPMKCDLKGADIRVQAYESLTPEQGRALWAAYVKRGLEVDAARLEGALEALKTVRAGIDREQSYREHRQDQDGSGVGACKEIRSYLDAVSKSLDSQTTPLRSEVVDEATKIISLVAGTMGWSKDKAVAWYKTSNPNFGGATPQGLVAVGRGDKVIRFIENAKDENTPPKTAPLCRCAHRKDQHIHEEGACRPGFVCEARCKEYWPTRKDLP